MKIKSNGKCMVAIQNIKGDFWQVSLDEDGQNFVLSALHQYFGGKILILNNRLDGLVFEPKKQSPPTTPRKGGIIN